MRADELDKMLERATDGGDHEWGWYVDDVPRLVARVRELEDELAAATDECHTLHARVHELEQDEEPESEPISFEHYILGAFEGVLFAEVPEHPLDKTPYIRSLVNDLTTTLTREDVERAFRYIEDHRLPHS